MKISKLFHWLYAFLMLLPVFFIGGRCLYVTFNKNAKDSYYPAYESGHLTLVDSTNQLIVGDFYRASLLSNVAMTNNNSKRIGFSDIRIVSASQDLTQTNRDAILSSNIFTTAYYNSISYFVFYDGSTQMAAINSNIQLQFDFKLVSFSLPSSISYSDGFDSTIYKYQLDSYSFLDNAFIYSVNSLNTTPLFSWAKTSFLVSPISYISGLFGIESTSPINTMLSYWLAISIIWLVFDIIMYVPLLAHRWIDKAKLE